MRTTRIMLTATVPSVVLDGCVTTYDVSHLPPEGALRPASVENSGNRITVTVRDKHFGVAPPNLCIRTMRAAVTIRVVGAPSDATIEVHEKAGDPGTWLRGSRTGPGEIRIALPDTVPNRVYSYYIDVSGFGQIDPMVSIER